MKPESNEPQSPELTELVSSVQGLLAVIEEPALDELGNRTGRLKAALKPFIPPEPKKKPHYPYSPWSPEWEDAAGRVARSFAPDIYACQKCGAPVITGYCCNFCGTGDPRSKEDDDDN